MIRPPISYRLWRILLLLAIFVVVYLAWSLFVTGWLSTADGWIDSVRRRIDDLNPVD